VILVEVDVVVVVDLIVQIDDKSSSDDDPCQLWASDPPDNVAVRQRPTCGFSANTPVTNTSAQIKEAS
jgi:hypothetical protein